MYVRWLEASFDHLGNLLGELVGNLVAGLEGEEHGLEAVTKEEAGTQGSACLTIDN